MLWMPGPTELLLIFLVILLLFGAKRIPEVARGLGRGIRDFKKALKDGEDELENVVPPEKKKLSEAEDQSKDKN